jgi:hypothetical protein
MHTVREKWVPPLWAFLSCANLPRAAEQASFVVAQLIDIGQPSTASEANQFTLHQCELVKPAMRYPLSLLLGDARRALAPLLRAPVSDWTHAHPSVWPFSQPLPSACSRTHAHTGARVFDGAHNPFRAVATFAVGTNLRARRVAGECRRWRIGFYRKHCTIIVRKPESFF